MKSQLAKILILVTFLSISLLAMAQTSIPDSAEARMKRASVLETEIKSDASPSRLRELAMIYSVIAGMDDPTKETTLKAEKILEKATKALPKDYELMAAHGSVLTMLARYESETGKQLFFVKKGFRKMDRAIKMDPENIGALLQRANNSLNTPVFLKRAHFAKKDFETVLELVGDTRGKTFKAMVLYNLGQANELMKDSKQAQKCWRESTELKAPYWSEKASQKLDS